MCFLTLDWMALCAELNLPAPSHARDNEIGCGFCGITMGVLRRSWWLDPFKRHHCCTSITDYPNAVFSLLSIEHRRYCMMHGSNANLSNTLTNLHNVFSSNSPKRTQFKQIVHEIAPKWQPKTFLEPIQTKQFFARSQYLHIEALFETCQGSYDIPWPNTLERPILPAGQIAKMAFFCLHFFHRFAYTKWLTLGDFNTAERA